MPSPLATASDPSGPDRLTLLAFLTLVVLFGLNFVGVRFSNRELAPMWGATLRFVVASAILLGIAGVRRIPLPRGTAFWGAVLYGVFSFAGVYALIYWGMVHVTAGTASVILATVPLLTLLMAVPLGLERFHARALAGALVVLVGVAIAFQTSLRADVPLASLLAVVGGAVCGAAGPIVVKRTRRMHPVAMNAVGMPAGTLLLVVATWWVGDAPVLPTTTVTWMAVAYLVFTSVVGFLLMVWILGRWTASAASYSVVLMPFVAVTGGALLAGEAVTGPFLLGAVVVLAGVWVGAIRGRGKPTPGAVPPVPPDPEA